MATPTTGGRGRSGRRNKLAARRGPSAKPPVTPGQTGGSYRPLSGDDQGRIHRTALDILEQVGMADALGSCVELVTAAGGRVTGDGRLCFPRSLVEDTVAGAARGVVLSGLDPDSSIDVSGKRVHFATAGAPVTIIDFESGDYRPTELADLYDVVRLVDALEHVHSPGRPLAPADLLDTRLLDINCAYAIVSATTKPAGLGLNSPEGVADVVAMLDMVLGGEGRFKADPVCHAFNCFVVPPLRFAPESCRCLEAQVGAGMPVIMLAAGQAGATAPAALAGAVVQTIAECLAGMVYVNLLAPGHPTIFAPWPLVSDLRTGATSGGGGEQAVLMAACAQMANYYDLPGSIAAGMTDSKLPDAQSGFEKGYTTALAALAGANLIHEAAGSQASLLGVSYEGFVIDNEMLGAVLRAVRGIEVTDETLSFEAIAEVATGAAHYLDHPQTLERMETDYLYPRIADRDSPGEWQRKGRPDIRVRARDRVREILSSHYPDHIGERLDGRIRERFDIRLPRALMKPGAGRW